MKNKLMLIAAAAVLLMPAIALASPTGEQAKSERVKIRMFFGTAGIPVPEDVKPDDNDFIRVFENAANVDVEMIAPTYQEFQTKFNLMMASGDIPDLVHCWFKDDVERYGREGAFKNWMDLLPKTTTLKTYYPPESYKLMQTTNGGIYGLNALAGGTIVGTLVRLDLVNEVNDGKIPVTPDDWYRFFKNIKAKYPDSVPIAPNSGATFNRLNNLICAFGSIPFGLQKKTAGATEYFWFLEHPRVKEAVAYFKKLYDEGLLYKEFATIKPEQHDTFIYTKKLAYYDAEEAALYGIMEKMAAAAKSMGSTADQGALWVYAPQPLAPGVTFNEANQLTLKPIGGHVFSINARADEKTTNAAIRFLEALADKKLLETCVWGREGIEYAIVNGQKVVNVDANAKTVYRLIYQVFRSYSYAESLDFRKQNVFNSLTAEQKAIYVPARDKGLTELRNAIATNPKVVPSDFVKLPDIAPKLNEAIGKAREIFYKALMGQITTAEFDAEVAAFVAKYQDIKNAYNAEIKKYAP